MTAIEACELPSDALLRRYLNGAGYADCYFTEIAGTFTHAEYVEAFYTTAVFKLERLLLAWFVSRPGRGNRFIPTRALPTGRNFCWICAG